MEFGRLPAAHLGLSVNGQSGEPELGNSMQLRISIVLNVSDKNGPDRWLTHVISYQGWARNLRGGSAKAPKVSSSRKTHVRS